MSDKLILAAALFLAIANGSAALEYVGGNITLHYGSALMSAVLCFLAADRCTPTTHPNAGESDARTE